MLSLALALLATGGGAVATYLYDKGASLGMRLCAGACIGLAAFGLIAFALASFLGLTPLAIALAAVAVASPFTLLLNPARREHVRADVAAASQTMRHALRAPSGSSLVSVLSSAIASILLWQVFGRAMIERPDGIYTGVINNFGDLPFHLSVITGFAFGRNFPPDDPTYAGVRFTYPFLTDFISAIFVRCGTTLRDAMFIENILLAVALVGVLHRWAWEMLRDRVASLLTPLLILLNGGLGWLLLFGDARKNEAGLLGIATHLPASFTVIGGTTWRWGNAISSLLVPQRGMLLGLALAVIVFTQWWTSVHATAGGEKQDGKRMIAAGVIAGLLPLVHAHSFVVVMVMGGCLALWQRRWRAWITFATVASIIAVPQMWWSTSGSAVSASSFVGWTFGWDHGAENVLWFWLKNTGLFIPLTVAAILWRGTEPLVSRRVLKTYLPFTLCFIVPNVVKLAPWIWDNIKVLFYWWVASAPLVALLLSRLWRGRLALRLLSVALLLCVTGAGGLDVASIVSRSGEYRVFDRDGIQFAELVKAETQPRALVLHAPTYNTPIFLTGRRSFMGYPGHIASHGLEYLGREAEIRRMYAGASDAESLLRKYQIEYAVVGPLERALMPVNAQFFSRFQAVGEVGEYRLYKITRP